MRIMNLLEQYRQLQKTNLSKDGDMQLGIAHKKENGLTTVKYLHGGVDFTDIANLFTATKV